MSIKGIDATGKTDVTPQLVDYFNTLPPGSVVGLPDNARYRIEGTLLVKDRVDLTIRGNGAQFFATDPFPKGAEYFLNEKGERVIAPNGLPVTLPGSIRRGNRTRSHLRFEGGSGIVGHDFSVKGAHPNGGTSDGAYFAPLEGQHAFVFDGTQGAEFYNVRATDVWGDFLYLGHRKGQWTTDVYFHHFYFDKNGRQGIAVTGAERTRIEDGYLGNCRRTAIDIEPNGPQGGARYFTLRGCTFGAIRLDFFAGHGKWGFADYVTVENNHLLSFPLKFSTNNTAENPHIGWRILNNTSDVFYGSPSPLMKLWQMRGLLIQGNLQRLTARRLGTGVRVTDSCDVTIDEGQFPGALKEIELINVVQSC